MLESKVERWFSGAAIITAVTILQREPDEQRRNENTVRFVQFFKPLEKLLPATRDDTARLAAVERLIESIQSCSALTTSSDLRVNPVRQVELIEDGKEADLETGRVKFVGGKWGKYLWAPDVFFKIVERAGSRLCKLSQVASVRRGFTTGSDHFFYLKDITDTLSESELKRGYGLTHRQTARLRVVEDGNGTPHLIESEFLKPVVTSPKEIDSLTMEAQNLPYRVLMIHQERKELEGTHVLKYVRAGETRAFGTGERKGIPAKNQTCANRPIWYDLRPHRASEVLWPKEHNERPLVAMNKHGVLVDQGLYGILDCDGVLITASLFSTFGVLVRETIGRANLGEGALTTAVIDVNRMPVLTPTASAPRKEAIEAILDRIGRRPILAIFEEVTLPDRKELDMLVLELLGFEDGEERERVRVELCRATSDLVRARVERATALAGIPERSTTGRRGQVNIAAIASELWQEFAASELRRFPHDFVAWVERHLGLEELDFQDGEIEVHAGLYGAGQITIGSKSYSLGSTSRAEFARYAVEASGQRKVGVPTDPAVCLQAIKDYEAYLQQLRAKCRFLAQTRTSDIKLVRKLEDELMRLAALHTRAR